MVPLERPVAGCRGVLAEEGLFTCRAKHLIRLTHKSVAALVRDFRLPPRSGELQFITDVSADSSWAT